MIKDEYQNKRIKEKAEQILGQSSLSAIEAILDEVYEWGFLDAKFGEWGSSGEPILELKEAK